EMTHLTFSIVSKALFSADTSGQAEEVGRATRIVVPWMLINAALAGVGPWMPVWTSPGVRAALKKLRRLVRDIVAQRRAEGGDRTPQKDVRLGGYDVPAGMRLMFSMYVTQRDARFFPMSEKFDPGRFSPERVKQIPDGAYMPFGAGVHMCPGNHFALMESRA